MRAFTLSSYSRFSNKDQHFAVTSSAIPNDYLIDIRDETRRWNSVKEYHRLPAVLCITVYIITVL